MSIAQYKKRYNVLSKQFREGFNNRDIALDLFDLQYELQSKTQTKENKTLQSHIYAILEYWQSAYELLLEVADPNDKKIKSKLFVFSEKARTHSNTFGVKDIRKYRIKKDLVPLTIENVIPLDMTSYTYMINTTKLIMLNKEFTLDRFTIKASAPLTALDMAELIAYLNWLGDIRKPLIAFYNSECNEFLPFVNIEADDDWYDTLDLFSISIHYYKSGKIKANISMGDQIMLDHIIELILLNKECVEMRIDG